MSVVKNAIESPELSWTRPRWVRTVLLLAYFGLAAAMTGVFFMLGETKSDWWIAAAIVLLLPLFFVIGSLNASIRGLTELGDRHLDEMQRSRRDAAYRRVYSPAIYLAGAWAAVLSFAELSLGLRLAGLIGGWLLLLLLPVALLALTLPDDPEDDDV